MMGMLSLVKGLDVGVAMVMMVIFGEDDSRIYTHHNDNFDVLIW